jgi:hypothetical protein
MENKQEAVVGRGRLCYSNVLGGTTEAADEFRERAPEW